MSSRFLILGALAAVAVLSLGWSAIASDGDEGEEQSHERWSIPVPPPPHGQDRGFRFEGVVPAPRGAGEEGGRARVLPFPPHPDGPVGPGGGELTWGELHLQRDGEEVVVRVDRGEVASVEGDSITVAENDGNDVEIPVDEATEVRAGPFRGELSPADLDQGDQVIAHREDGGAAESIDVLPELPFARPGREGD